MTDRTFSEDFNRAAAPIIQGGDTEMGNTNEGAESNESNTMSESKHIERNHFTHMMQQYGPISSEDAVRLLAEYRVYQESNDTSQQRHLPMHQQVQIFLNKKEQRESQERKKLLGWEVELSLRVTSDARDGYDG